MYDAVSLAAKAALFNTRVPRVTAAVQDGGTIDLTLSDDPFDCERLDIDRVPNLVTICKIGEHCVVDPSADEEVCSSASVVIGVSNDGKGNLRETGLQLDLIVHIISIAYVIRLESRVTTIRTNGSGSFHPDTLNRSVEIGLTAGQCLDRELMRVLRLAEEQNPHDKQEIFGFLK